MGKGMEKKDGLHPGRGAIREGHFSLSLSFFGIGEVAHVGKKNKVGLKSQFGVVVKALS